MLEQVAVCSYIDSTENVQKCGSMIPFLFLVFFCSVERIGCQKRVMFPERPLNPTLGEAHADRKFDYAVFFILKRKREEEREGKLVYVPRGLPRSIWS